MQQNWIQIGQDIDGEAASDQSGRFVSLSDDGTRVAIGAPNNDGTNTGNASDNQGSVRVYDFNGTTWTQVGNDIDGGAAGYRSGYPLYLSGDGQTLAITSGGYNSNTGQVNVYRLNGSSVWTKIGQSLSGTQPVEYYGSSVSLSKNGSRLAVGSSYYSPSGNSIKPGLVRVFDYNGSAWVQIGSDLVGASNGDSYGCCVSLSRDGTWLAVGAYSNDTNGMNSGQVRVYNFDTLTEDWFQVGMSINGEASMDQSGTSISLSDDGKRVAIAAIYNAGNGAGSGHVRVYEYLENWSKIGQDIDGEAAGDESGRSISLSGNGTRLAVGAMLNDGTSLDNLNNCGHVRVYDYNGTSWVQIGQDIDGEGSYDRSGNSVSLSLDGTRLAIGAYLNNGASGTDSGSVRIYSLVSTAPCFGKGTLVLCCTAPTEDNINGGEDINDNKSDDFYLPIEEVHKGCYVRVMETPFENTNTTTAAAGIVVTAKTTKKKKVVGVFNSKMRIDFSDPRKCFFTSCSPMESDLLITGHHGVCVSSLTNHPRCTKQKALKLSETVGGFLPPPSADEEKDFFLIPAALCDDFRVVDEPSRFKEGEEVDYYHLCVENESSYDFNLIFVSKNNYPVETLQKDSVVHYGFSL